MDHELAVQTHAAERYVVGEMPSEERDAFEEHYAGCKECLSSVHGTVMFAENARAVFQDREQARYMRTAAPARNWLAWLTPRTAIPIFAALALATVISYQNAIVIPGLEAPRAVGSALPLDGETRSSVRSLPVGKPLEFRVALDGLTPGQTAAQGGVTVEIADAAGKIVKRGSVQAPGLDRPLDVYFPGELSPGRYTLVVRTASSGQPGRELVRNQFEIVSQESTSR
jgi:hypothetical protein